jgi:endonuclease/exonuclease/phosphatase family metal-dependent hydrolase
MHPKLASVVALALRWASVSPSTILTFAFASLASLTLGTAAVADDRNDDTVRVMTRNMYQGFDPAVILGNPNPVAGATAAYQMIVASKPAERAAAVAREIVRNRVDIVGIQEATIVRKGPSPIEPATEVVSDSLVSLLDALEGLGERYHVVAIVPNIDAQLPTALGFVARVSVRDAIIARSRGADLKLSNVQVQGFLFNRTFPTAFGVPLLNPRGWASVDVEKNGRTFRFATAHLEQPDPPNQTQVLQAHDMIHGAGNTPLPVVFVGDFNSLPGSPGYLKFINAGFMDAWSLKRPGDPGFTCCQNATVNNPTSQLSQRIDLVLFRGAIQVTDIDRVGEKPSDRTSSGLWPSDHAGVVAKLKIPRPGGLHH